MPGTSETLAGHRRSLTLAVLTLLLLTACDSGSTAIATVASSSASATLSASASSSTSASKLARASSEQRVSTPACTAPNGSPADTLVAEPSAPHGLFVLSGALPLAQSQLGPSIPSSNTWSTIPWSAAARCL